MNVLIIPEDFRKDQFILKPIVRAMLKSAGQSSANVRVCQDPLLRGVAQATDWARISEILERYMGMYELILLCVDRDGVVGRRESLDALEDRAALGLRDDRLFLAENAWQELEVWILAGHDLPSDWGWRDIRAHANPKERYYLPFAEARGVHKKPAQGRETLALEAARRYSRIRQRCPEDIQSLHRRIEAWIATRKEPS